VIEGLWHLSNKAMDGVNEVLVTSGVPTLSVMWALEDSDDIQFSSDILDAPEFEPRCVPSTQFNPADAPILMQPLRQQSLALLKREKGIRMVRHWEQSYDASQHREGRARMKLRSKGLLHSAEAHADNDSEVTETTFEPSVPLRMASTTSCFPDILKQSEASNARQPADIDASAPSQQPRDISTVILAGAASLGLRKNRNRSTSVTPVHHSTHPTNTELKAEVRADESSTKTKIQQWLKETNRMPCAPSKPPQDGHRKRPQIRGVPVLVVCAN